MSGQTIKDVVIRIAIEANASTAINGLQEFQKSVAESQNQLTSLAATLDNLVKQPHESVGGNSATSSSNVSATIEALRQQFARTGQQLAVAGSPTGSNATPSSASSGIEAIRDQFAQIQNLLNKYRQLREEQKQEQESAKKVASANVSVNAAMRDAAHGATELARSIALIVASGNESDKAILKNIGTIQSYSTVVSGTITALNGMTAAMKTRNAAAAAGSVAQGAAGAAGASGGGGMVPPVPPAMLTNPWVLLAAAAVATAVAIRQLQVAVLEEEKSKRASQTKYAAINEQHANAAVGRHVDQSLRMVDAIPDPHTLDPSKKSINRGISEENIRTAQNDTRRGFGWKQEIRARGEQELQLKERRQDASHATVHAVKQLQSLSGVAVRFEDDKAKSKAAYDAKIKKIKEEKLKEGGTLANHLLTGEPTDAQAKEFNLKKDDELRAAARDREAQLNAEQESGIKLQQKKIELGQRIVQSTAEQLAAMREITKAARLNYEKDQETVSAAARSAGALTPGERTRMKALDEKRKLHESGVTQQFSHWEKQALAEAPEGTKANDFGRKLREMDGADTWESSVDLKASKKKAETAQEQSDAEEGRLEHALVEQGQANQAAADKLVEQIKKAFSVEDQFAELGRIFEAQAELTKEKIIQLKKWFK